MFLLKKLISIAITAVMLTLSISACPEKHTVKDSDEVKLNFTVLSDCHIEGLDVEFTFIDTYKVFTKILKDAKSVENGNDAIVFLGDNTMNGQDIESMLFYGAVNVLKPGAEILVAAGNHDLSNGEGTYAEFSERFMNYNNTFFGDGLTKPYFYKVINGCYFIVLSSEEATVNTMYLSDEQLIWLKGLLNEADENNAPVFVMAHHPANYLEAREGDELTDILNDYYNLLYFCGHTHAEFTPDSVYELDGVSCINLPRCTEWKTEGYDTGIGAQVELYDDEILVRIRDFHDSVWLEEYEYSYPIEK
ncbi:MAG: metallophosphoesterase [Clostridia bacterium]|nr:metallophosphoesterase [Clostridia bacterium]